MGEPGENPILYGELAPWFHLLTAPSSYEIGARQAARRVVRGDRRATRDDPRTRERRRQQRLAT